MLVVVEARYLSSMLAVLGQRQRSLHWASLAANLSRSVHAQLWDESSGSYRDRIRQSASHEPASPSRRLDASSAPTPSVFSPVEALTSLYPLLLDNLPPRRLPSLLAALKDPRRFGTPLPLPSVSRSDPAFSTDMWRGPVWLPTSLLVVLGLITHGATDEASRVMAATVETIGGWYRSHGALFEFYDADNATPPTRLLRKTLPELAAYAARRMGGGIRDYHWTAAVLFIFLDELKHGNGHVLARPPHADAEPPLSCARELERAGRRL